MKLVIIMLVFFELINASVFRVISGSQVNLDDSKWESTMLFYGTLTCGASLISPQWVLTAAHCARGSNNGSFKVGFGNYSRKDHTLYDVEEVFLHPEYDNFALNDIALVKLKKPITNITPMTLDKDNTLVAGTEAWAAGWGRTIGNSYESSPNILREVMVPIQSFSSCAPTTYYFTQKGVADQICAGYINGGGDICTGDSGGPLIIHNGHNGFNQALLA